MAEHDPKRTFTYRDGWRRSKISSHTDNEPAVPHADPGWRRISWMFRPAPFLNGSLLKYAWYVLPVLMFLLFQWMVWILARLT
ncbi:hypothetical protein RAC89_04355 [Paenibacillus sp. GD4]|uniref:hypothetical protein n=1 Tax=Paenibacillus sp. GD4 TaxID=3068890 RepID=UPI002796D763|nr:hypothetical protein [Paenibacillus sp. GD4]MDQ1909738.1 hypothetical protein [Paenibacillus sp. GD4]